MPMLKPTGAIMFWCNGHSFTDVTCMYVCMYVLGKKGCPDSNASWISYGVTSSHHYLNTIL